MERLAMLEELATGNSSLVTLAGLDETIVRKIEAAGGAAFSANRFVQAAQIFDGLCALEPQEPRHHLHLGHALASLGELTAAVSALSRYLELASGTDADSGELIRALLTRAQLWVQCGERERGSTDVRSAEALAGDSAALLALVHECSGFVEAV